jgi:hypothetical protein
MTASLYQSRRRSSVAFARAFLDFRHPAMFSTGDCVYSLAVAE